MPTQNKLALTLKPGEIVTLVNLPAHRNLEARQAVEAKGTQLRFLPPKDTMLNDRLLLKPFVGLITVSETGFRVKELNVRAAG
jgi:hypothetical protein